MELLTTPVDMSMPELELQPTDSWFLLIILHSCVAAPRTSRLCYSAISDEDFFSQVEDSLEGDISRFN